MTLNQYYVKDQEGYLLSTVYITEEEAASRTDLSQLLPPSRPLPVVDIELEKLNTSKAIAVVRLKDSRDRRLNSVIVYSGSTLQADINSKTNIIQKINEAETSVISPEALFWRDYYNNSITFNTQETYLTWLKGLLSAISARTTEIMIEYWYKKDQIQSAVTIEQAYSITM